MVRKLSRSRSDFRGNSRVKDLFGNSFNALRNAKGIFVFGLLIGILVYYGLGTAGLENITGMSVGTSGIEDQVVKLYEIQNPGAAVEILEITSEGSLFKVRANLNGQLVENYVTKDGQWLIIDAVNPELYLQTLEARKTFLSCLADSGLLLFGSAQSQATLTQMQLLGGPIYLDAIYVNCDGENTQACIDSGVTEVPAIAFDGQLYPGVRQVDELSSLTGCQFSV
jgi:hypothetical protein